MRKVLIIGAGAAVQSVLFKIIKSNPESITLTNRSEDKAKKLCAKYSVHAQIQKLRAFNADIIHTHHI